MLKKLGVILSLTIFALAIFIAEIGPTTHNNKVTKFYCTEIIKAQKFRVAHKARGTVLIQGGLIRYTSDKSGTKVILANIPCKFYSDISQVRFY